MAERRDSGTFSSIMPELEAEQRRHFDELAGSLPACWAKAAVTAPSPRDQAAAAGPAVGPGPPAVPV